MFAIEQTYDIGTLTVLCRVARKTTRRLWRIFRGVIWAILAAGTALLLYLLATGTFGRGDLTLVLCCAVMLAFQLFDDRLSAWAALRQMVPGTAHTTTVFEEDAYTVKAETLETRWQYENISSLCETEGYFICFLGKRHYQIFDKQGFRQGTPDAFRNWLEQKTGKTFQSVR